MGIKSPWFSYALIHILRLLTHSAADVKEHGFGSRHEATLAWCERLAGPSWRIVGWNSAYIPGSRRVASCKALHRLFCIVLILPTSESIDPCQNRLLSTMSTPNPRPLVHPADIARTFQQTAADFANDYDHLYSEFQEFQKAADLENCELQHQIKRKTWIASDLREKRDELSAWIAYLYIDLANEAEAWKALEATFHAEQGAEKLFRGAQEMLERQIGRQNAKVNCVRKLQEKWSNANDRIRDIQHDLDKANHKVQNLQKDLDKANEKIRNLQTENARAKRAEARLPVVEDEKKQLVAQKSTVETRLNERVEELKEVNQRLSRMIAENEKLAGAFRGWESQMSMRCSLPGGSGAGSGVLESEQGNAHYPVKTPQCESNYTAASSQLSSSRISLSEPALPTDRVSTEHAAVQSYGSLSRSPPLVPAFGTQSRLQPDPSRSLGLTPLEHWSDGSNANGQRKRRRDERDDSSRSSQRQRRCIL